MRKRKRLYSFDVPGYWESRYSQGGNSGAGSSGKLAQFKADVLNEYVALHSIASVVEFGCGDGNQLRLAKYPKYLGIDISTTAVELCRRLFADDKTKQFLTLAEYRGQKAELSISLDVIYHLVDDLLFEQYMRRLLKASTRHVVIYSSNTDRQPELPRPPHVRHHKFSRWMEKNAREWVLMGHIKNPFPYEKSTRHGSFSDFFIFRK